MWIIPTMGRPEQCTAVLNRMDEMGCSTEVVVFINGRHRPIVSSLNNVHFFHSDKNIGLIGALNQVFELYPNEPWYGFIADDEFVETLEFDKKLIEAAGDWNIAHGDDGFNKGVRAQGYLVIGGKLARAVGYLAIPECWHWYGLDDMWETLAQSGACKKIFVSDVKIDHRHPMHGKGKPDETYASGESRKDIDQQVFFHWLRHKRADVVESINRAKG